LAFLLFKIFPLCSTFRCFDFCKLFIDFSNCINVLTFFEVFLWLPSGSYKGNIRHLAKRSRRKYRRIFNLIRLVDLYRLFASLWYQSLFNCYTFIVFLHLFDFFWLLKFLTFQLFELLLVRRVVELKTLHVTWCFQFYNCGSLQRQKSLISR
jgi:hypothetical protein